ncbi:MAG: PBP1A family penicillin-binding protein, partial [Robiginitomaculum sp.]|nr:PBP1A family penicillin-binding protein [Robiginitomaculum sp.]
MNTDQTIEIIETPVEAPAEIDAVLQPVAPVCETHMPIWQRVFRRKAKPKKQKKKKPKWLVWTLWILGLPGGLIALMVFGWFGYAALDMPDTSPLWMPETTPQIVILDRYGREILRKGGAEAKPIDLDTLPARLPQALIAIEDRRFYKHPGFDPIGLMRAAKANFKAGRVVQGGSTLTQQLAKNVFLTREQTMKRKTQEIMFAVWLELRMSKQEILETYLSRVYFGGGTIGIESGAQRFFNKPAKDLNTGEIALLVGLLKAPDRLNPLKNRRLSAERTARVLAEMRAQGYLTPAQWDSAMTTPIEIEPLVINANVGARYFTDWVLATMDKEIGQPRSDITIHTSLDLEMQKAAEIAVRGGLDNKRNAQQAALMTFDGDGAVRAMVGGVDYRHSSFNRALSGNRQPGSAFKPFVYLAALKSGRSAWDIYHDKPVDIDGWKPGNFSNEYLGAMSMEKAMALSINTVAVQVGESVGRNKVVETAHSMGLDGLKPYASLALGAQEMSLYDLTAAYVPFANWGYSIAPRGIEAIYANNGDILYTHSATAKVKVLDTQILGQMNMMLSTVVQSGTGKAAGISGRDVAGKTGTTNDYRDAWFVGYTADFVTGVWVGNDDNSKMARVTGGTIPARIWQSYMSQALGDAPATSLPTITKPVRITDDRKLKI